MSTRRKDKHELIIPAQVQKSMSGFLMHPVYFSLVAHFILSSFILLSKHARSSRRGMEVREGERIFLEEYKRGRRKNRKNNTKKRKKKYPK